VDSKSVTCPSCNSIIDLSQGIGGELRHAAQDEPVQPLIAIGAIGQLQGTDWQVVGFQHRMGVAPGDDEHFGWSEYLLYNKKRGFSFLVDAEDGWSWTIPITGVPQGSGDKVQYEGASYRKLYDYVGQITYVLGEFYWQLTRDQRTFNTDYQSGARKLNRERTATGGAGTGNSPCAALASCDARPVNASQIRLAATACSTGEVPGCQ
jgi:hypothetical protein